MAEKFHNMQFKIWLNIHIFDYLLQMLLHKASSSGYPLFVGLGETSRGMFAWFPLNQKTCDAKNRSRFSGNKNKTWNEPSKKSLYVIWKTDM